MEMIDQHGVEKPVSTQLWFYDSALMAQRRARRARSAGADIVAQSISVAPRRR